MVGRYVRALAHPICCLFRLFCATIRCSAFAFRIEKDEEGVALPFVVSCVNSGTGLLDLGKCGKSVLQLLFFARSR